MLRRVAKRVSTKDYLGCFTKGFTSNHQHGSCAKHASTSLRFVATTSVTPFQQQRPATPVKMSRVLAMEINKIKSLYKMNPTPQLREESLNSIASTPLSSVQQLDLKTVTHLLGALEELKAPVDHPIVREASQWISANANSCGASMMMLAQGLCSVSQINPSLGVDLMAAVQPCIMASLDTIDAPVASKLLSAARAAGLSGSSHSEASSTPQMVSWQEKCVSVLRRNITSANPSDLLTMAHALNANPNENDLFTEIVSLAGSLAHRMPPEDLAQLVPLVATCRLTAPVREARLAEVLKALEAVVTQLSPSDASTLYEGLRGFEDLSHPQAVWLVELVGRIPLANSSVPEALSIAGRLGERTPQCIINIIKEGVDTYFGAILEKPAADIAVLFAALAVCPSLQQLGMHMRFADKAIDELRALRTAAPTPIVVPYAPANVMAALVTEPMVIMYGNEIHGHVMANFEKWKHTEALCFISSASHVRTAEVRRMLRDMAQKVAQTVHLLLPGQLAQLACAYGRAGVRNDVLCNAVSEKVVAERQTLGPHGLSSCLGFLAAVDYRNNKCFVEVLIDVRTSANECGPAQVVNFIVSYAKMLLWNLKLFYPLVARAAHLAEFFSIQQIIALLVSVERVDVRHSSLTVALVARIRQLAPTATPSESVKLLAAMSKYGITPLDVFEVLGNTASRAAKRGEGELSASDLGELLMSFTRAGFLQHNIYHDLLLSVLGVSPTATPLAICNLATAYSSIGLRHEELFEILADRTLVLKEDTPAVVIAGILAAFARVGIRKDKLFIEMINRVRSVPTFGTPQDIVNVVTAYSLGGVWHLRLFVKLAERAVHLRGEFRGSLIAELLAGFARVEMKYDKLFAEFSPRVQACALTLSASNLVSIVNSYATVMIPDAAVFEVAGDRLSTMVDRLSNEEKKMVMAAYAKVGITHGALASALSGLPPPQAQEQNATTNSP